MTIATAELSPTPVEEGQLQRSISWTGAFWVASGVPPLVLFSIGGIAGATGTPAFAIWTASMLMGFLQSFVYAEMAGLFPNKSGGSSVYGAAAWIRYAKPISPLLVWCNWIAWTPVLSLGCTIAAAYILNALVPDPNAAIRTWTLAAGSFGPVSFSLNTAFFIGVALMLTAFAVQYRGISGTAQVQRVIGLAVIIPLLVIGIAPLLQHGVNWANFTPFVPLAEANKPAPGAWNATGWTLVLGGMFLAAWSTYAFETSICYTSEFKNPKTDTFKAIFYSGLLCLTIFLLVPFTFQSELGLAGMLDPSIADGSGVAAALVRMVGGGPVVASALVMLMIFALLLCLMTAMAGASRTLYQGSLDGWMPKYLGRANRHGAPIAAMWTGLVVNLGLLAIACADSASFFFILAVSNAGYIIFNFLNLNSGWIHRIDNAHIERPYKAPTVIIAVGAVFGFVNAVFLGAGAKVWHPWALWAGIITAGAIIPVFLYRHYIQDRGQFPLQTLRDLGVTRTEALVTGRKAGLLPYLTLAAGVATVLAANFLFQL
ncbi:APC family permease [Methylorubrum extorquens]|uniref:APC family permease n=1 Tax=Methylorubrum extorquens TaxID=408 RepID=UPI001EE5DA92|nr:APC family permease [Methylorubrum extorquens]MCG5249353.1 APC family permease [Methylorubrum extorquens]